jgi:hypothetical protein
MEVIGKVQRDEEDSAFEKRGYPSKQKQGNIK